MIASHFVHRIQFTNKEIKVQCNLILFERNNSSSSRT